jgi:hypothetical protein
MHSQGMLSPAGFPVVKVRRTSDILGQLRHSGSKGGRFPIDCLRSDHLLSIACPDSPSRGFFPSDPVRRWVDGQPCPEPVLAAIL